MKLTPTRIITKAMVAGPGTGIEKGQQVYPATKTLMKKIGISQENRDKVLASQMKFLDVLPDFKMDAALRKYQIEDVKFLAARNCMACFNEQRTGKTPTALYTMKVKGVKKLLIISPASTLYTWATECKTWWSNELPVIVVDGTATKRKKLIKEWAKGALIISYECLRERTVNKYDELGSLIEMQTTGDIVDILKHKDIEAVILDEAHRIKNHKSNQAEALFKLSKVPIRMALTGTPAPGKQHEIYSILHWLYPNIFTGYWRFIDYYFTQYEEYNAAGSYKVIGTFKRDKDKELQEFLNVISTRRMRASVMDWLPEKDKRKVLLPQTKEQEKYITELNQYFEIEGTNVDAVNILAKLMEVRQILLSPELLGLKGSSPKIDWIKQYLRDYPDKQVLIFSNFTKWLKLLGKELKCNNFIIGETSKAEREKLKNEFQSGKIKLLLINIKAGKEGITLDNADVSIFTDKYPPVGDIMQAEDRFVATTREKLIRGNTIIDLVMQDSYEVNILQMLDKNASEVDIINNYIKYIKEVK